MEQGGSISAAEEERDALRKLVETQSVALRACREELEKYRQDWYQTTRALEQSQEELARVRGVLEDVMRTVQKRGGKWYTTSATLDMLDELAALTESAPQPDDVKCIGCGHPKFGHRHQGGQVTYCLTNDGCEQFTESAS